jgi:hypothetical protein
MRKCSFGRAQAQLLLAVALLVPYGLGSAATLVLKDGAVIHGEIKTLHDEVYTVETGSLGTLRVRKQDVQTIDHGGKSSQAQSVGLPTDVAVGEKPDLQAIQSQVAENPDLLSMIQALQNDSEVQAVLADPEIMAAVAAGDYSVLMNHPKIIALTNNTKVREVIEAAR